MAEDIPVPADVDPQREGLHPNEVIANNWFASFNTHDLGRLLSLYDEQAKHYSPRLKQSQPQTEGWIQGQDALRAWWQDAFARLPSLQYRPTSLIPTNEGISMTYVRSVDGEEDTVVHENLEIKDRKIVLSRVQG
ncbi:nuclear transport factor 2 family protein [Patescibacteria group bacterium]|nr:nuclear transport factor 2 family protein [Patescibacteria group bacterium]